MKKRIQLILVFFCLLTGLSVMAQQPTKRPKVGVVLSGGGAKGVAHIGALKVIEEVGIPVDIVVGTSMGSIIGGMYAIGYTPAQMDSLVREQDWTFLLTDRVNRREQNMAARRANETYLLSVSASASMKKDLLGGAIRGENLANLFSRLTIGYHDSIDFNKLPVPFACVSEDVASGKEVVFHSGVLATAMRSSMAIPAVFTPIRLDSMVLVDGGTINNYPVDVARKMGADIVIGVDVQNNKRNSSQLKGAVDILNQLINLMGEEAFNKNIKDTDMYIKVDVEGYSAASFSKDAIDTLIVHGEQAATAKLEDLKALKAKIGLAPDERPDYGEPYPIEKNKIVKIDQIAVEGMPDHDVKWLRKRLGMKEKSEVPVDDIERVSDYMRANLNYSSATYKLHKGKDDSYDLNYTMTKKSDNRLSVGARFDSKEIASLLLNGTLHFNQKKPSTVSATIRLGKRIGGELLYSFAPTAMRNISLGYKFMYNDIDFYHNGDKAYNSTFRHHQATFSYTNVSYRNLSFDLGLHWELYDYVNFLFQPGYTMENTLTDMKTKHFFTYYTQWRYESLDKPYFPTKGLDTRLKYELYTDNFTKMDDHTPISSIQGDLETVFSLSNNFAVLPSVYGRFLFGKQVPYPKMNAMGGDVLGYMIDHQLPFIGINSIQEMDNSLLVGALKFRERLGKIHYVTLSTNYALNSHKLKNLLQEKTYLGVGLTYGIDTFLGPIELTVNYNNRAEKLTFFFNLGHRF